MTVEEARRQAAMAAEARARGIEPWQLEMMNAVGDGLVRDLVNDFKHGPAQRSSLADDPGKPSRPRATAVPVASPLAAPPGIGLVDKLVELQDRIDRADRARELAKAARPKPEGGEA